MIRKIATAIVVASAIAVSTAGIASADDPAPAPPAPAAPAKPPPLSAAGLGLHIPELSASGLFNKGRPFAYPPLSAGGICHYVFKKKNCGKVPS